MEGCSKTTPMEEIAKAPEDAVLRDKGAVSLSTEQGVDGCVVIKVEMDGEIAAESGKGQCSEGSKEFSSLLSGDPIGAGEEAGTQGESPNADEELAPGRSGSISEIARSRSRHCRREVRMSPSCQSHGQRF